MNYSEVESKRFGMNVFRQIDLDPDYNAIAKDILKNDVDLLILRIPADKQNQLFKLERKGFPYLVADSLVYYKTRLADIEVKNIKNNEIEYVIAEKSHESILCQLVQEIFNGYTNHYFSNPYIQKQSITEGYQEWANSNITNNNPNKITFLIKRDSQFIGFACCSFNHEKKECEGILYGVVDNESGKGIYSDLIRYTQKYFKSLGYLTMKVSTQLHNIAVQRVWTKEGFLISETLITIHINSFINASKIAKISCDLIITEEEIKKYGDLTGDLNPLHFDEDYAISKGFDSKIAHGIIVDSYLTKFFGMDYPGSGTIFLNYTYSYFKPLYLNKHYKIEISFPVINSNGFHLALARILDEQNNLCLLSYNQLLKR